MLPTLKLNMYLNNCMMTWRIPNFIGLYFVVYKRWIFCIRSKSFLNRRRQKLRVGVEKKYLSVSHIRSTSLLFRCTTIITKQLNLFAYKRMDTSFGTSKNKKNILRKLKSRIAYVRSVWITIENWQSLRTSYWNEKSKVEGAQDGNADTNTTKPALLHLINTAMFVSK